MGATPQDTPHVTPQDPRQVTAEKQNSITDRILDFYGEAKSRQEILSYLGLKDRKNLMLYINQLLEQGRWQELSQTSLIAGTRSM